MADLEQNGQAGTQEWEDIKVTSEMVEAGIDELIESGLLGVGDIRRGSVEATVRKILSLRPWTANPHENRSYRGGV